MRAPRALLTLLTLSACGGSNDGESASAFGSAGPTEAFATTQADETGTPTTAAPTTGAATTGTGESTGSGTDAPTTGSTGAIATGDTGDTGTTAIAETGTDTGGESTGDTGSDTGTTTGTDGGESTGPGCPEGQNGCPCGPGDACDPGLACAMGVCGPPAPKCGDGKIDPGEVCDDGVNNGDDKACKLDCSKQVCGDGKVGPGEVCDDGVNNGNNKVCKADCSAQKCGDGFMGPGEQCDDGNLVDGDGCQKNCVKTPVQQKDACGFDTDGVWFQIDYSNAFSVSNPTYTYSPTPGWGEAQWAPTGKDWPYAVDLFNNAKVINDQIGTVALLDGTGKAVRVYFGIAGLNYTYATVCVEGRSYSVGSQVQFFVMEAKTKCGDYGMMANDWTVHATGVDLQDCFIPGDEFQAVQVQPSGGSGSLSLKRLRVTLHGASY
jgi:cysteine-rich repeat protein